MIVSDNTIKAECLGDFFKNLGKSSITVGKNLANNVVKNPGRALDITTNTATSAASRSPKNVISLLPELMNNCHTGKGFSLENLFDVMFFKWNKKQKSYTHLQH